MNKNIVCKNNISVNKKTIKLNTKKARLKMEKTKKKSNKKNVRTAWYDKKLRKEKVYFYNIKEKMSYDTAKLSTWNSNKNKEGFLYSMTYRNFIYNPKPGVYINRMIGPEVLLFYKTESSEIEKLPSVYSNLTGITKETPFAFKYSNDPFTLKGLAESRYDKPMKYKEKLSFKEFLKFIKEKEELCKHRLKNPYKYLDVEIDKYENLMDKYYYKSISGNGEIFGIVDYM